MGQRDVWEKDFEGGKPEGLADAAAENSQNNQNYILFKEGNSKRATLFQTGFMARIASSCFPLNLLLLMRHQWL